MTTEEILRALKRMAHQIVERNKGTENVVILGILNGGLPIAKQLADYMAGIEEASIPCGSLDISKYRDDLDSEIIEQSEMEARESLSDIPCDIKGKHVVLVDDVLYTGRTARAAFDALSDYGRAATIQLAVLVDRGHRELPIRADYIGKNVPTSHSEVIALESGDDEGNLVVNIYDL